MSRKIKPTTKLNADPFFDARIENKGYARAKSLGLDTEIKNTVLNRKTGEIHLFDEQKQSRDFIVSESKIIDRDPKVSLIASHIAELAEMSMISPVLAAILFAAANSKTHHCSPDFGGIGEKTVQRHIAELIESKWVAPHGQKGRFWINWSKFAGFDRGRFSAERDAAQSAVQAASLAQLTIATAMQIETE